MKFILLSLFLGGALVQAAQAAPVAPARADDFVDSIGVCTHWSYYDTPYGDFPRASELLGQLGVRHIRDGLHPRERELWERFGIKTTANFGPGDVKAQLQSIKEARAFLAMIEGPNEVDIFAQSAAYKGKTFPEGPRLYQRDLFEAIKSDPQTAGLGVIAPSTARAGSNLQLAPLDSFDFLVMHSYAGGNKPTEPLIGDGNNAIREAARLQGIGANLKPIVVTESGYHTAVGANLTLGGVQPGISEATGAKYFPRHFAEYFNAGIKRTFTYEFLNEFPDEATNAEASFGLVRRDFSPKPAYGAIKNLISLLGEAKWNAATQTWDKPNPNFAPRALDFDLGGESGDIHSTTLQKADGTYYLLLWREVSSWNIKNLQPIENAPAKVTLTFQTPMRVSGVRVSDNSPWPIKSGTTRSDKIPLLSEIPLIAEQGRKAPTLGGIPLIGRLFRSQNTSFALDVPDEMIALQISPSASQPNADVTAPAPPSALAAKTTGTSAVLSWKAAPDADVAGYFVSRFRRSVGRVTGTAFSEEKLDPATGYSYAVRAYDRAGNISPPVEIVATTQDAFPDLVVSDIRLSPTEDKIGDESHFLVKVQNIGNAPTARDTTVGVAFSVDGKTVAWSDTLRTPLAAGEFAILRSNNGPDGKGTWKVTAGTHELRAIVDDVNRINESKETNNIANLTLKK